MKKTASVKTRITIWYTSLMFVLTAVVLTAVGTLAYRLSIDNAEKGVTLQVTRICEKIGKHHQDIFKSVDNGKEFKNVSIYDAGGNYIAGQYVYDVAAIKFKEGAPRRETADGKEYIIYDVFRPFMPGKREGFWVRGAESLNSAMVFGRLATGVMIVFIPLILLLATLGGYFITKKAFLPVNSIIATAKHITAEGDMSERILIDPAAKHDELYDLSVTLNQMLAKTESLILREKQFTSDASHELRTPISVILAQGEYLLDIAENDKEKELAENIVQKAKQLSKLVSRLLLLARMDQNRQKLFKEKVNIGAAIDIAAENLRDAANKKHIMIFTDVPEEIVAEADEALLLSAITNLVSNAVKYGKEYGKVIVSAYKSGSKTEIAVEDDGIGISSENTDKIWERFYRADEARNDEFASCGLGLATVKGIAEMHGGSVEVKSTLGVGTRFVLRI